MFIISSCSYGSYILSIYYSFASLKIDESGVKTTFEKLKSKLGPDRFDGNKEEHIHFECNACHEIEDISIHDGQTRKINNEIKRLSENIGAECENANIWLTGLCKKCKRLASINYK